MSSNSLRNNGIHRSVPPAGRPWVPAQKARIAAFTGPDRGGEEALAPSGILTIARKEVGGGDPCRFPLGAPILRRTMPGALAVPANDGWADDLTRWPAGCRNRNPAAGCTVAIRLKTGSRASQGLVELGTGPVQRIEATKCLNHPRIVTILNPVKKMSSPASPWNA